MANLTLWFFSNTKNNIFILLMLKNRCLLLNILFPVCQARENYKPMENRYSIREELLRKKLGKIY